MQGDERDKTVRRLLKRGLNYYGLGDVDAAIVCWEEARALDPENQAAQDYLETAYEEARNVGGKPEVEPVDPLDDDATPRSLDSVAVLPEDPTPRPATRSAPRVAGVSGPPPVRPAASDPSRVDTENPDTVIGIALQAYKSGDLELAWTELQRVAKDQPDRLDVQGYLQLVRSERAQRFAKEIGDQGRVLRLRQTLPEIMKLALKPDEGFLLSQIDGRVTIADLINLSTSTRVRTLEIIARLLREGIVE